MIQPSLALLTSLNPSAHGASKGFMDSLPDPMKLDLYQIGFVMLLVTVLYFFLKLAFFKPVVSLIQEREAVIQAGAHAKAEAASRVEKRQADYQEKLRELRAKAFEHRKALALAAAQERHAILDGARARAATQRSEAAQSLQAQTASARKDLVAQVDALAESMVRQLLKQA